MMKHSSRYVLLLALAACSSSASAPQPKDKDMPAAPAAAKPPTLAVTAMEKLGSAPSGFGLEVGAMAPDATLPDVTSTPRQLAALYREGPTFVVFYRGGWCPFCNMQLHQLAEAMPQFAQHGFKIVAISVDLPSEEAKTQAKHGVPFPMLSDSDLTAHKAFHVVHPAGDQESNPKFAAMLEQYSGQQHHAYAVASIFLVDRDGKVLWRHVDEDYKTRPSAAQLLDVAAHLKM